MAAPFAPTRAEFPAITRPVSVSRVGTAGAASRVKLDLEPQGHHSHRGHFYTNVEVVARCCEFFCDVACEGSWEVFADTPFAARLRKDAICSGLRGLVVFARRFRTLN